MGMTNNNLCDSCINIGCTFQSGIKRTECAFYIPPHLEPDSCGSYVVMLSPVEAIPKADYEVRLKADMVAMLKELKYDLYRELCHEIHGTENGLCTNQTASCLATFRVRDADRAIGRVLDKKISELEGIK